MLTKATRPSQRQAAATVYADATMVDYGITRGTDADAEAVATSNLHTVPLLLLASASVSLALTAEVANYGDNEAVAACGIVSRRGTLELGEGILEHNISGNIVSGSGGGSGAGLSGVDLQFDQTDPDNPVLNLRQDAAVVASAALPKASSVQAGIIESSKFDEIGTGGGAGDIDGGTF